LAEGVFMVRKREKMDLDWNINIDEDVLLSAADEIY
jgi:hypothetical protein